MAEAPLLLKHQTTEIEHPQQETTHSDVLVTIIILLLIIEEYCINYAQKLPYGNDWNKESMYIQYTNSTCTQRETTAMAMRVQNTN